MRNTEKGGKRPYPILMQVAVVLLVLCVLAYFILSGHENAQEEHNVKETGIGAQQSKEAKAKADAKDKQKPAPTSEQKKLATEKVLSPDTVSLLASSVVKQPVEPNPLIEGVDKNYGKPNVEFIPTVEEKSTTVTRTTVVDEVPVFYGRHNHHGWDNYSRYNSGSYWSSSGSAYDTPAYVQGSVIPPPPPIRQQVVGVSSGVPAYSTPAYVQGSVLPPVSKGTLSVVTGPSR